MRRRGTAERTHQARLGGPPGPEDFWLRPQRLARDVAGGNWEHASQAPSPGPSPSPPSPSPKRENDVLRACHPKKKTRFYEHVMCVVFCVALPADLAEQTSTVAMSSQATYTARGLRQPRPPLRGHIFSAFGFGFVEPWVGCWARAHVPHLDSCVAQFISQVLLLKSCALSNSMCRGRVQE